MRLITGARTFLSARIFHGLRADKNVGAPVATGICLILKANWNKLLTIFSLCFCLAHRALAWNAAGHIVVSQNSSNPATFAETLSQTQRFYRVVQ